MLLLSFTVIGVGAIASLWAMGLLNFFPEEATQADPYLVRIPINTRPIPAYSKVQRAHLLDSQSGWLKFQELPPNSIIGMSVTGVSLSGQSTTGKVIQTRKAEGQLVFVLDSGEEVPARQLDELGGALMNVGAIIGRVVKRDKTAGLGFREANFLPRGTPEGIAGATPPGMRSFVLEAGQLSGVHTLPVGARIDLIANIPLDDLSSFDRGHNSRLPGAALVLSSSQSKNSRAGRTEPILLAQDALVLRPVYQRVEAKMSSSLVQGSKVQAAPVYEVALAVHPGDVIPLQSALSKEIEVICVAHSMQPSDKEQEREPEADPLPQAPMTSRSILAYETLTFDYFEDPATRRVRYASVEAADIERLGIITSIDQLVGVVVKHDIPKGSVITQADLLRAPASPTPESPGSDLQTGVGPRRGEFRFVAQRGNDPEAAPDAAPSNDRQPRPNVVGDTPNIARFIPEGHRAVAIPWNRLYGAEHLQIGDTVDLSVSYSLQYEAETREQERQPDGTVIERTIKRRLHEPTERTYDETLGFRGEPWFAALNAKVIGPVGFPPPSAATRFLGEALFNGDSSTEAFSGPPVVFAIEPKDREAVSAALATENAFFAIVIHPPEEGVNPPQGWKRIVLAPEGIPAYESLTTDRLHERHTRRPMTRLVREDDENFAGALSEREMERFEGRVLRRYKRRRGFFTVDDFFPAGVQPGFAADVRPGSTVYVAPDRDIEGLEHFRDNDLISILFRGVTKRPTGVISHGADLKRPIASVIVPQARILRASQEGMTVLEINNADLARLQAAWAAAFTDDEESGGNADDANDRLHLVAVSLPTHSTSVVDVTRPDTMGSPINDYDPVRNVRVLEAMVGDRRDIHVFAEQDGSFGAGN